MTPEKLLLYLIAVGLYLGTTFKLLSTTIPEMLREADSATNGFAILAVFAWVLLTLYILLKWHQRKSKKGTKE